MSSAPPHHATLERLEAALARGSGSASDWNELAGLRLAAGDAAGAAAAYRRCLALTGPSAGLQNNLGTALIKAGRPEEAIAALETALLLQPGYQRALVNLGKALRETGRFGDSTGRLNQALASDPGYVPALVNLGDTLTAAGDLEGAARALEHAAQLAPSLAETHANLGMVHLQAGRIGDCLASLHTALRLAPHHAGAHSNLFHALMVIGDWQQAWPHFEYRFRGEGRRVALSPPVGMPRWEGTLSPGLELWLMGEQGLGDQLQFARYAALLAERGASCVIACDPRLVRLLSMASLGVRIVPLDATGGGLGTGTVGTTPIDPAARWFPLMSLPGWHATRPETVPAAAGYLAADPHRIAHWRSRLPTAQGLRVALAWAGNPRMETGRYLGRSPPPAALGVLLRTPGVRFISLQKGPGEDQLDVVPLGHTVRRLEFDTGADAFLDTAAILGQVDLLITSDTAIAHLAGGLGVPTWLCVMHDPDWRWVGQGASTPWYASMRLFRQPAPGDWAGVYAEVARELAVRAAPR